MEVASLAAWAQGDVEVAALLEAWVVPQDKMFRSSPRFWPTLCLEASLLVLAPLSFRPRGICLSSLSSLQSEPKRASLQHV